MNPLYIYHHLGLGDHLICNGLVRNIYKNSISSFPKIFLFCKENNIESVTFMFSDLKDLEIIKVKNDKEVNKYLKKHNGIELKKIGFEFRNLKNRYFDQDFYKIAGIDFNKRWDDFLIVRDYNREKELFKQLGIKPLKYIFFHDDIDRKFKINEGFIIHKDLKVIKPFITKTIFDWCTIIENAKEIHCIDSSFRLLADSLKLKTEQLFFHQSYIYKDPKYISSSKYHWNII